MARTPIKLKAPAGTDEVNVGTHLYRVDNNGFATVPPEDAAVILSDNNGFTA